MDFKADAVKLQTLSREQLKRAAKVLKLKGYSNKNKSELISMISENKSKMSDAEYDANQTILRIREVLGLSTSGNVKSATQGIRKSKKEADKPAKQQADEALKMVKDALSSIKKKPKLSKQFLKRLDAEMKRHETFIDNVNKSKE
tara:strand:+ start:11264 stop:11698 length:435 start_codon:yes stop_codon:yes gene_type:complete